MEQALLEQRGSSKSWRDVKEVSRPASLLTTKSNPTQQPTNHHTFGVLLEMWLAKIA